MRRQRVRAVLLLLHLCGNHAQRNCVRVLRFEHANFAQCARNYEMINYVGALGAAYRIIIIIALEIFECNSHADLKPQSQKRRPWWSLADKVWFRHREQEKVRERQRWKMESSSRCAKYTSCWLASGNWDWRTSQQFVEFALRLQNISRLQYNFSDTVIGIIHIKYGGFGNA